MFIRKHRDYFYKYPLILICYLLLFLRNAVDASALKTTIFYYMKLCFGGIPATGQLDIMSIFFWIVPNMIILYCFSDNMRKDCSTNYVYVFTRVGNKGKWLSGKARQLLFHSVFLFAVLFITAFLVGKIYGLPTGRAGFADFYMLLSMFLLNSLTIFILMFVQNFLSLRHGSAQSYLIIILFYMFSFTLSLSVFNVNQGLNIFLFLLIPNNQIYLWHPGCAGDTLGNTLSGFRLLYSYLILIFYAGISYLTAHLIFKKLDLAELIKEA